MDRFQVVAEDTTVLDKSHIVEEMKDSAFGVDVFPVLIGEQIGKFHDVDGGYDREQGCHIVNLIHRVQGLGSPPRKKYSDTIEIHLDDYYFLEVADVWQYGDYPSDDYTLSLRVTGYQHGPYAFSEALSEDIDKREQEFSPDNVE